jgi:hypothetical protein
VAFGARARDRRDPMARACRGDRRPSRQA